MSGSLTFLGCLKHFVLALEMKKRRQHVCDGDVTVVKTSKGLFAFLQLSVDMSYSFLKGFV